MEPNFQTSFIPKKPIIEERVVAPRSTSLLTVFSVFILIAVLVVSAGLYFYKGITIRNIAKMENDLNLAKNRFEPAKINELQQLDKRLNAASGILSGHIAITPIFEELQAITMKTVRYTKFDYVLGTAQNKQVVIKLKGQAIGYSSIALQSDLFTKNEHFIDPVFSNLTLDDKGNVLFDLEFSVDPSFVDYKQMLLTENFETNIDSNSSIDVFPVAPPSPVTPITPINPNNPPY